LKLAEMQMSSLDSYQ